MKTQAKYLKNLRDHNFHKLIVGAALKDYQTIEDFSYYFSHAGADVIDISAFPHSVLCAKKGIKKAIQEAPDLVEPLIMISVNIGEDPHFRRIELDKSKCTECLACVPTCPSKAFSIGSDSLIGDASDFTYNADLCFGCSNCLPSCNFDALSFENWSAFNPKSLSELKELGAKAIELHLNNDLDTFKVFYKTMPDFELESFCIGSEQMIERDLERATVAIIETVGTKHNSKPFIIQTDGVPLSGASQFDNTEKDLVSIKNAILVKNIIRKKFPELEKNIFVQLAGGITEKSLAKAFANGVKVNGIAIGSYARKIISETDDAISVAKNIIQSSRRKVSNF